MKGKTLLLSTVLLALLALVAVSPAAAQGAGEVNVTVDPADATVSVGETQTYEVVVESPDNGILAYDNLILDVDSSVAEVVAFRENHTSNLSSSEITNDNSTLSLSASPEDDLKQPAPNSSYTLVEFDVTATAGGTTGINFNQSANAIITDFNDTAYSIGTLSGASLTAEAPPTFEVSNVQPADATVTNGTVIDVSADIENVGTLQGTQTITLSVGGVTQTQSLALNASENATVTFSNVDTGALGPGSYTHTVSSANDSASGNLTVQQPANFGVSIQSTNSPVVEGETLDVTAAIQNTGDVSGTQDVSLSAGGLETDSQSVTLAGGASQTVTLSVGTTSGDAGTFTATVSSANDSASQSVTVQAPANFQLTFQSTNSPVAEGEDVTVTANVENTGDVQGTQTVTARLLDQSNSELGRNSTSLTLAGGASQNVTLSVGTGAGDAGSYTAVFVSSNDSTSLGVTVQSPANFSVSIKSTNSPVVEGETLDVTASIQNTGDVSGTQDVSLSAGGLGTDSQSVTLASGASQNVTLSVGTTSGDAGTFTAAVSSANNSASQTVTVQAPANFSVSNLQPQSASVTNGTTLSISADVANTGDVQGTQTITLSVGTLTQTQSLTLAAGANATVTFSNVDTGSVGPGSFTSEVASANDSATGSLTVQAPVNFVVSALQPQSATVVSGTTLNISAEVTNTGDVESTQAVTLSIDGFSRIQSLTLAGGANQTVTFQNVDTGVLGSGTFTHQISTANSSVSGSLTVQAPANFGVSIQSTTTPVEGKQLNVTASIQNTGDVSATQTVSLDVGALGTDSQSVTLAGGASTTVTLGVSTGAGDAGTSTATVSSADDSASQNVTVLAPTAPANFQVSNFQPTDKTFPTGSIIDFSAEVTNVGDVQGTQAVTLSVGGFSDTQNLTIAAGANETFQTAAAANALGTGIFTTTVTSANDTATGNLTVAEAPNFGVSIQSATTPVEGEQLNVTASIQNTGDVSATQAVSLDVGSLGTDSTNVTLAGGASTNVTLGVSTSAGDAGTFTATVSSANDSASQNVTVQEPTAPANFEVSNLQPQSVTVTTGAVIDISADVTNTGDVQATQALTLSAGTLTQTQSLTLAAGANQTVTFSDVDTGVLGPGAYTHEIASANDSASGNLTVQGTVSVESFEVSATELTLGETLSVDATVRNTGLAAANLTVPLRVDGATVDTAAVQVGANTSTTVTLQADSLSLGEANVSVANLATRLVTVAGPALDDGKPATDPDDDGQYEDIDGDGTRDLVDVQTLFLELDNPLVTGNEDLFNFQPLPGVSVLDVQELFNELPE